MSRRPALKPFVRDVYDARAEGASCSTCVMNAHGCQPVRPRGGNGRLVIVHDFPTAWDDKHGQQKSTEASKFLERSLTSAQAPDYVETYAIACKPFEGATNNDIRQATQQCQPRLMRTFEQARAVDGPGGRIWGITLGSTAFEATTGKMGGDTSYLGSPVDGTPGTFKVIPTWAPGFVRSPSGTRYAAVFQKHLDRAADLATGRLGDFEWPEIVVDDSPQLLACLQSLARRAEAGEEISVDIETRGLGLDSAISCIGFASHDDACCVQLPLTGAASDCVRRILAAGVMVGQNISAFDRRVLTRAGYTLTDKWEDTLLAASILDPQLPRNLSALVNAEFHAESHKAAFRADVETGVLTGDLWGSTDPAVERERRTYCAKDAYTTLLVRQVQKERLAQYGAELYEQLKKLDAICHEMSDLGMEWDFEAAAKLRLEYEKKVEEYSAPLIKFAEKLGLPNLNLQSPKQLQELYFQKFRVAPIAWSDKGTPQLNEDVLTAYISGDNQACAEFSKRLLDVRAAQKLLGSYIENGPEVGKTTVHGRWKAHGTVTGRFSCPGFGMQTMPAEMRKLLRAPEGMVLTESDMSQLEIRLISVQADIKLFRETYDKNGDVYLATAVKMFQKPGLDKNTPEGKKLRQLSKTLVLSCNYLAGDETVYRTMYRNEEVRKIYPDLTLRQVVALRKAYLDSVPELVKWWAAIIEESSAKGYYEEKISGRRVYFYGPADGSFIASYRNQALAAHLMNRAFLNLRADLKEKETLRLQCHDAIVLCGPDGQRLEGLAKKHMTTDIVFEGRAMHLPCEYKTHELYSEVK